MLTDTPSRMGPMFRDTIAALKTPQTTTTIPRPATTIPIPEHLVAELRITLPEPIIMVAATLSTPALVVASIT